MTHLVFFRLYSMLFVGQNCNCYHPRPQAADSGTASRQKCLLRYKQGICWQIRSHGPTATVLPEWRCRSLVAQAAAMKNPHLPTIEPWRGECRPPLNNLISLPIGRVGTHHGWFQVIKPVNSKSPVQCQTDHVTPTGHSLHEKVGYHTRSLCISSSR